ncbi:MAG: hypothetical protein ACPGOV_02400 [Magnetovibrionaceae bacterium]
MILKFLRTATFAATLAGGISVFAGLGSAQAQEACTLQSPTTILLVDLTEQYDEVDRRRLSAVLNSMVQNFKPSHRLEIFPLYDRPEDMVPLFSTCYPGCEDTGNAFIEFLTQECTGILVREGQRKFVGDFANLMARLVQASGEADATRILQTFSTLAPAVRERNVTNLVIFSDMIEYSPETTVKIRGFDEREAGKLQAIAEERMNPGNAYAGIEVDVFGFGRRLGSRKLENAWLDATNEEKRTQKVINPQIPIESQNARKTFWENYFRNFLKVGSLRISNIN